MSDYRFGVDDYSLNYYPHDGVHDEQECIDWSKVERVEIDWVDFVRERTCHNVDKRYSIMFKCSECGHWECQDFYEEKIFPQKWNYCPNCGAKVID